MKQTIAQVFTDEDRDAVEAWNFSVAFDVDDGEITILPALRTMSDENAAYAS